MYRQSCGRFLLLALSCAAFGQNAPKLALAADASVSARASGAAAEVLAAERAMEAAVVRGDVAYVERVAAPDLSFTHGDGWTTGGSPLSTDDRKAFLKRVENKQYNVRDLDSVKVEMHGDIAITYGRYVAQNRIAALDECTGYLPVEPGSRCGSSVSTRNETATGCMCPIARCMVRPTGRTGSR